MSGTNGESLFSLHGLTAVVVGGGGVLAGAMSMGLAKAGANVAVVDNNLENARGRAEAITQLGRQSAAIQCDATSKAQLEAARDQALAQFGEVDILVNAAGINSATPFFDITEAEWQRILDV
ncbi:MAG: SDR family oxidoreductase, partial [Bryobacterales bacterium]|nr:SDR family oxidoreductase [Bryobacterales bacterium]